MSAREIQIPTNWEELKAMLDTDFPDKRGQGIAQEHFPQWLDSRPATPQVETPQETK